MIGNLYFLQEGTDGAIKIGWTSDPAAERTGSSSQPQTAFEQAKKPNPQTERGTEND